LRRFNSSFRLLQNNYSLLSNDLQSQLRKQSVLEQRLQVQQDELADFAREAEAYILDWVERR